MDRGETMLLPANPRTEFSSERKKRLCCEVFSLTRAARFVTETRSNSQAGWNQAARLRAAGSVTQRSGIRSVWATSPGPCS